MWLLTSDGAISAGVIAPDESGRAPLVSAISPRVRPVLGVSITVEPSGGSPVPSACGRNQQACSARAGSLTH